MTPSHQDPASAPASAAGLFAELVRRRRSCRRYELSRPVPRALLDQCLDAARLAPSACNRQPWRFIVVDEPALLAALRAEGKRAGIPHPWWDTVPVFVVVCAQLDLLAHRVAPMVSGIPYYLIDIGIAGEHFVLAAESLGLGTCWIGWFNERSVKRVLHLPRSFRPVSLITVGWPALPPAERPEPAREELQDIRRWNRWE